MEVVLVTPALNHETVEKLDFENPPTVIIIAKDGREFTFEARPGPKAPTHIPGKPMYTADISSLPEELLLPVTGALVQVDHMEVMNKIFESSSFEEFQLKAAQEMTRQLEVQHFAGKLYGTHTDHLEEPLKQYRTRLASLQPPKEDQ